MPTGVYERTEAHRQASSRALRGNQNATGHRKTAEGQERWHEKMGRRFADSMNQIRRELKAAQKVCAICGTDERQLDVDHDHACCPKGRLCRLCVRDRICVNCNLALGLLDESPERAEAIAAYLRRWGK